MTTTSPKVKISPQKVQDYLSVIKNAAELYELYTVNRQLEIIKNELMVKRELSHDDSNIVAEIDLACELQELCRRRV